MQRKLEFTIRAVISTILLPLVLPLITTSLIVMFIGEGLVGIFHSGNKLCFTKKTAKKCRIMLHGMYRY